MNELVKVAEDQSPQQLDERQISAARTRPRDVKACIAEAVEIATIDETSAGLCIYKLPRGGKELEGPSVRLAEIVASVWGNLYWQAEPLPPAGNVVRARCAIWDLEKNLKGSVVYELPVRQKGEDGIKMTTASCVSYAFRNAVERIIPKLVLEATVRRIKDRLTPKDRELDKARRKALDHFASLGVSQDKVLRVLGRNNPNEITAGDVATLRGYVAAVTTNPTNLNKIFDLPVAESKPMQPATTVVPGVPIALEEIPDERSEEEKEKDSLKGVIRELVISLRKSGVGAQTPPHMDDMHLEELVALRQKLLQQKFKAKANQ